MILRVAATLLCSIALCLGQTPTTHPKTAAKAKTTVTYENALDDGLRATTTPGGKLTAPAFTTGGSGFTGTSVLRADGTSQTITASTAPLIATDGVVTGSSGVVFSSGLALTGTATGGLATDNSNYWGTTASSGTCCTTTTSGIITLPSTGGITYTMGTLATSSTWSSWDELNAHTIGYETRPFDHKGPTVAQVDESALPVADRQLAPAAYVALAKAIKMDSPSADEAQMLQVIHDHHFRVYDYTKVDNYLYRQALKQGSRMRWVWKPMRQADVKAASSVASTPSGYVYAKLYGRRVPQPILEDAKCVLDKVEDAVFLVSDFEAVQPDPFLAVSTPKLLSEGKLWIIDRWDEPGFDAPSRY
jgi:hypothetical protein